MSIDSTLKKAGVRRTNFSDKDELIPTGAVSVKNLTAAIESRKAKMDMLLELRDSPDDKCTSYVYKRDLLEKNIAQMQGELAGLNLTWQNLSGSIDKVQHQINRLEGKKKLVKNRSTIEKLLKLKLKIEEAEKHGQTT